MDLWLSLVHNKQIKAKTWIHLHAKRGFQRYRRKRNKQKLSSFSLYVQVEMVQIVADANRPLLTELLISLHAVTCYMIPSREWAIIVPPRKAFPENTWKCISGKMQYPMHWMFCTVDSEYYNLASL